MSSKEFSSGLVDLGIHTQSAREERPVPITTLPMKSITMVLLSFILGVIATLFGVYLSRLDHEKVSVLTHQRGGVPKPALQADNAGGQEIPRQTSGRKKLHQDKASVLKDQQGEVSQPSVHSFGAGDQEALEIFDGEKIHSEMMEWYTKGLAKGGQLVFTEDRLKFFNGRYEERPMVLCVTGRCFDVSEGKQFYFGAHEPYNCFVGRGWRQSNRACNTFAADGTRAFVTGQFNDEGATDDLSDVKGRDWGAVGHWIDFYADHPTYKQVGTLVGPYFDEDGVPTAELARVLREIERQKHHELEDKRTTPPCNSKYTPETGTVFWCSVDSGGIERDWVGFPRKRNRGDGGECVCIPSNRIQESLTDPQIKEFDNCESHSESCSM